MLTTLSIKHFTIVSELTIDFEQGMTAFTGETGAGKSIMLDALSLILGQRADISVIRDGETSCELSAAFSVKNNPDALVWLKAHEVSTDELILRRILHRNGRSKAFINGVLYPLQKVRELGDLLLHIHGQNEQYHLLKHEVHRAQLDAFALNEALLLKTKQAFDELKVLDQQISQIESSSSADSAKALLSYQLQELDELALNEGEVENLNAEHKMLSSASSLLDDSHYILQILEADNGQGVLNQITKLQQLSSEFKVQHTRLDSFQELLNSAQIQLEEASSEMTAFQQQLELDPSRLQQVEARIEQIFNLARKHQVKPEELMAHHQVLQSQFNAMTNSEHELEALKQQRQQCLEAYLIHAESLRKKRSKEATVLAAQITTLIKSLGMPNGAVQISLTPLTEPTAYGMDRIEYIVSLNPGSSPKPLAKIASGGELSRLSLAIQVLTAEKKAYPTLMFDEVDSGIGGAIAAQVGVLLRRLANHTQVFCVTHQAQVASNANWHIKVVKQSSKQQTQSKLWLLDGEHKISELARMMSGVEVTEQTLAHARELLAQAICQDSDLI